MSQRFRAGLVVGKFAPLHLGHELVISTALAQCDQVYLISYSNPELAGCPPERRERWLKMRFPSAKTLLVTAEKVAHWQAQGLQLDDLPDNDAPDAQQRRFVAQLCQAVLRDTVDAVFTSEHYGDGFATQLSREFQRPDDRPVVHVQVDLARQALPISGTRLRADVHGLSHFLAPEVYADFVSRICLLGGESTGKSTLAVRLAEVLGTRHVAEYGRERWEQQAGELIFDDLLAIATEQCRREDAATLRSQRHLVCDTSPLTTLFYSQALFGRADPRLHTLAERRYDLTLLCAADFPFVQDGTRQGPDFQIRQQHWYEAELQARSIPYSTLRGSLDARIEQACSLLK